MPNLIDILINASWLGGPATTKAATDLRGLSNRAAQSSVEMAASAARTGLLNQKLSELGVQVVQGTKSVSAATAEYREFESGLARIETTAPKTTFSVGGLVTKTFALTAAVSLVSVGLKKVYGLLEESAGLELTERRFDRLARSIGTTGEVLKTDIANASRGVISDLQAATLGTDLLSLGIATNSEELVRFSNVVSQLGIDLNQLVLSISNQTTLRFDQMGIAVVGFDEKLEAMKEQGYSVQDAFKLAFLQQAEQQIERVGSAAETTAGKIQTIRSAWEDVKAGFKEDVARGTQDTVDEIAAGIRATKDAESAIRDIEVARLQLAVDQLEGIKQQEQAVQELKNALDVLVKLGEEDPFQTAFDVQRITDFAAQLAATGKTVEEQQRILEQFGFEVSKGLLDTTVTLEGFSTTWEAVAKAIEQIRLDDIQRAAESADQTLSVFRTDLEETGKTAVASAEEMQEIQDQLDKLEFEKLKEDLGLTEEEYLKLAQAEGGYARAREYLNKVMEDAGQVTDDLSISSEELREIEEKQRKAAQERAKVWLDFQADLTDISVREGKQREKLEATHEARRTEIVDQFSLKREQAEEDFQRNRTRAEAKLNADIAKVQAGVGEEEVKLREQTQKDLAKLERDHGERMTDIINNANAQLTVAAGRLDASTVVALQQQKDLALRREEESYGRSRDEIESRLAEQIQAEKDAAAERIIELKANEAERQRLEDEDWAIRLQREDDAHQARLDQIDAQNKEQLDALEATGDEQLAARADQYEEFWKDREDIDEEKMKAALTAEEAWWTAREALVPTVVPIGPNATNLPTSTTTPALAPAPAPVPTGPYPTAQVPGVPTSTINVGDITIEIAGGGSPEETANRTRDVLIELFDRYK